MLHCDLTPLAFDLYWSLRNWIS